MRERKAQANRANARKSTGPKTPCGKARAAGNARRFGLSLSVLADPMLSDQVAVLTRKIAGETSDANIVEGCAPCGGGADRPAARAPGPAPILRQPIEGRRSPSLAKESVRSQLRVTRSARVRNYPAGGLRGVESNRPLRAPGIITPPVCCSRTRCWAENDFWQNEANLCN